MEGLALAGDMTTVVNGAGKDIITRPHIRRNGGRQRPPGMPHCRAQCAGPLQLRNVTSDRVENLPGKSGIDSRGCIVEGINVQADIIARIVSGCGLADDI